MIDPFWEVPPTHAIAVTIAKMVTSPLKILGEEFAEAILAFLRPIPVLYQPFVVAGTVVFLSMLLMIWRGYGVSFWIRFKLQNDISVVEKPAYIKASFPGERRFWTSTHSSDTNANKATSGKCWTKTTSYCRSRTRTTACGTYSGMSWFFSSSLLVEHSPWSSNWKTATVEKSIDFNGAQTMSEFGWSMKIMIYNLQTFTWSDFYIKEECASWE